MENDAVLRRVEEIKKKREEEELARKNELNDKLDVLKKAYRINYIKNFNAELITDKEADALLTAEFLLKQKEIDLNKEYYEKYKKILPIKKITHQYIYTNEYFNNRWKWQYRKND